MQCDTCHILGQSSAICDSGGLKLAQRSKSWRKILARQWECSLANCPVWSNQDSSGVSQAVAVEHSEVNAGGWESCFGAKLIIEFLGETSWGVVYSNIRNRIGWKQEEERSFRRSLGLVFFFPFFLEISKPRIGVVFASYNTQYKHGHLSKSLLKRGITQQWKTGKFSLQLLNGRLIFSLYPLQYRHEGTAVITYLHLLLGGLTALYLTSAYVQDYWC